MRVFQKFLSVSGLQSNQRNSCIYFGGVPNSLQEEILLEFGMTRGELPFRYLGVPLSTKKLTVIQCQPLIKMITTRVECWISKLLSYSIRIQLIKTGATNTSKRSLMAWDNPCLPKFVGGWNLMDIHVWNKVPLCKLLWKLAKRKDSIWIRWVHGYYVKHMDILTMNLPANASWVVRKIIGARNYLSSTPAGLHLLSENKFSVGKAYVLIKGEVQRVEWQTFICSNIAPQKYILLFGSQCWNDWLLVIICSKLVCKWIKGVVSVNLLMKTLITCSLDVVSMRRCGTNWLVGAILIRKSDGREVFKETLIS